MQKFSLVLLKEEFFDHYYHKSYILYDFLTTFKANTSNEHFQRQFDFITMDIPYNKILQELSVDSRLSINFTEKGILMEQKQSHLIVECNSREWTIYCASIHDAEHLLFERLRRYFSSFFVFNTENSQYGWLSPVRKEIIL